MEAWTWDLALGVLGLIVALVALVLAARANRHALEANRLSEQAIESADEANRLSERSIRVSKLPYLQPIYGEFREMLPRLREPDQATVERLASMTVEVRLVSQDDLFMPFHRMFSLVRRIWADSNRTLSSRAQAEGEGRRRTLEESITAVDKAFQEFLNR